MCDNNELYNYKELHKELLYPSIPAEKAALNFRISEVCNLRDFLDSEIKSRESTLKKYKKIITVTFVSEALISMIMGILVSLPLMSGISLNSTTVSIVSCVFVGLNLFLKGLLGFALKKSKKHNDIVMLARSKLDSIGIKISKVLDDSNITDIEFKDLMSEKLKYRRMVEKIQKNEIHASNPLISETDLKLAETKTLLNNKPVINDSKIFEAVKLAINDIQKPSAPIRF